MFNCTKITFYIFPSRDSFYSRRGYEAVGDLFTYILYLIIYILIYSHIFMYISES